MKICVIGVGYVGLVTGTCFAEMGHQVVCLDIDAHKIEQLKKGEIPIYEPGLKEVVLRNQQEGRLSFTTSYPEGLKGVRVIFIAVDTPPMPDGQADQTRVFKVAESIATHMESELLVITKSTVPPGTTFKVKEIIANANRGIPFSVASNPEFLKEGSALSDCLKPDRVIVGIEREEDGELLHKIFAPFMLSQDRLIMMDIVSAELTKYAANAMLATRISFMNELSRLAEVLGADIQHVRRGIGSDKRIGQAFLYPGIGYGGSCFPKDVKALAALGRSVASPLTLIEQVEAVNHSQIDWFIQSILDNIEGMKQPVVAIWGLSFKPDTDDMREAPALTLIKRLIARGAELRLYDPIAMDKAKSLLPDTPSLTYCANELEAVVGADATVLVTEWRQFRTIDMKEVLRKMRGHLFFDGRNQYSPQEMAKIGFYYKSVGQPVTKLNASITTDAPPAA